MSFGVGVCFAIYAAQVFSLLAISSTHKTKYCFTLLLLSYLSALFFDLATIISLPFILALFLAGYLYQQHEFLFSHRWTKRVLLLCLVLLSLAFSLHVIPGFNNALIFLSASFGASGLPFKLYANLDKAIAGCVLILAMGEAVKWKISVQTLYMIALGSLCFFSVAVLIGANVELKFGELTLAFIFFNLFVTCFAEEAFFRLVVQRGLNRLSHAWLKGWFSVVVTAFIFMLAHYHTGVDSDKRMLLIFLAGLLYGAVYLRSKSLGSAIAVHFVINFIHFSFFTYPATFN